MNEEGIKRLKAGVDQKKGPWKKKMHIPKKVESRVRRTDPKDSEAQVQKEVVQKSKQLGVPLWRQQAGRVCVGPNFMTLAPAGAADLTGILPNGVRLEVECKRRYGGKQSKEQKQWQKYIESMGGVYLLVRSSDEFVSLLSEHYSVDSYCHNPDAPESLR